MALLDEASSVTGRIAVDRDDNPALILGAAIAGTRPLRDKLGIVADGTYIVGFADWAEQLIAESTGKNGKGLLPVVLDTDSPEIVLHLAKLEYIDSSGLALFIEARKLLAETGRTIRIADISPQVGKLFNLTQLGGLFGLPE